MKGDSAAACARADILTSILRSTKRFNALLGPCRGTSRRAVYWNTMSSNDDRQAELSCTPCKRLKRRCSKCLPTCSLCARVGRRCVYPSLSMTPTRSEPSAELETNRLRNRGRTPTPLSFSSTAPANPYVQRPPKNLAFCFLDSIVSRGVDAALPCDLLWRDVSPSSDEITHSQALETTEKYFGTTHLWLPVGELP